MKNQTLETIKSIANKYAEVSANANLENWDEEVYTNEELQEIERTSFTKCFIETYNTIEGKSIQYKELNELEYGALYEALENITIGLFIDGECEEAFINEYVELLRNIFNKR